MIKPMVFGFCSIGGWRHCGWWEWDLGTLAQFWWFNSGLPLVGLPLSGFSIVGYVCGFPIRGAPAWIIWVLDSHQWGAWNFEVLVEEVTGSPSLIAVRIESLFTILVPVSIKFKIPIESFFKWGGWGGSSLM